MKVSTLFGLVLAVTSNAKYSEIAANAQQLHALIRGMRVN